MAGWFANERIFWRQFRSQFHTTGAVLPSGRFLARSMARYVGQRPEGDRVLEVGPGTGAVTSHIVRALGPNDRLDLVELNDEFVRRLNERFAGEAPFCQAAGQCRVLHCPVEELPLGEPYDLIISGLPLNNFSVAAVEGLLAAMRGLLKPGGKLTFFEYIAIRQARALVSGTSERQAAARNRRRPRWALGSARDSPRLDLAQRAAGLGAPRADRHSPRRSSAERGRAGRSRSGHRRLNVAPRGGGAQYAAAENETSPRCASRFAITRRGPYTFSLVGRLYRQPHQRATYFFFAGAGPTFLPSLAISSSNRLRALVQVLVAIGTPHSPLPLQAFSPGVAPQPPWPRQSLAAWQV